MQPVPRNFFQKYTVPVLRVPVSNFFILIIVPYRISLLASLCSPICRGSEVAKGFWRARNQRVRPKRHRYGAGKLEITYLYKLSTEFCSTCGFGAFCFCYNWSFLTALHFTVIEIKVNEAPLRNSKMFQDLCWIKNFTFRCTVQQWLPVLLILIVIFVSEICNSFLIIQSLKTLNADITIRFRLLPLEIESFMSGAKPTVLQTTPFIGIGIFYFSNQSTCLHFTMNWQLLSEMWLTSGCPDS